MIKFFEDKSMRRRLSRLIPSCINIPTNTSSIGCMVSTALMDIQHFDWEIEMRIAMELRNEE